MNLKRYRVPFFAKEESWMKEKKYAGVVVDQVHPSTDKLYHYAIPEDLLRNVMPGLRVLVPFGRRNIQGYILTIDNETDISKEKIRYIKKVLDPEPAFEPSIIPLIFWMKKEYHCMLIEAIRCFIPPGLRFNVKEKTQKVVYLERADSLEEWIHSVEKRSPQMAAILNILHQQDNMPVNELLKSAGATYSSIRSLLKKGYIRLEEEEIYRNPWPLEQVYTQPPVLNDEQRKASKEITQYIREGRGTILLHGVTGSGKTEIYMKAAEEVLLKGRQVIVLVPEISLTPQAVNRFKSRFGNKVAVLHSRLSIGERYDEWRRIRNNEVPIVVGARSAVFAPLKKLGLIILDEAHEDSYKSEVRPRYHALEVASKRCEADGAVLILGSATPALEDYYKAQKKEYHLIELKKRADNQPLPYVTIIDMRRDLEMGNRSIFSNELYKALKSTLLRNEQAILLLNRRGYAQFVSCRKCGYVIKCTNCDVSMTYHAREKILKCHYCDYRENYPRVCPVCNSKYIKYFGIGTQKAEEEIKKIFPGIRVLRMDYDTTSRKGSHYRILSAFDKGEYDVLLGTQMIAKGLDFPNVTLVGVLAADSALYLPDYRSSEKTFQLITQVAGRAGRGNKPGRVIIQTYQPDHYAIKYASKHDYVGFYQKEIIIRKQFEYPPFSHIIRILMTSDNERELVQYANNMVKWIRNEIEGDKLLQSSLLQLGAYVAPIERIKNRFRWQILIRFREDESSVVRNAYHKLAENLIKEFYCDNITLALDFNPLSLI